MYMKFFYGLIALFYGIYLWGLLRRFFRDCLSREKRERATLIDRYTTQREVGGARSPRRTVTEYFLAFQGERGVLRFQVSYWVYTTFQKGETGLLVYQGGRFIRFGENEN